MDKKISNLEQIMYARLITLDEINNKKVIDVYNGVLECLISLDNGLDILSLKYKGKNISFLSKNGINSNKDEFQYRFEGGMLYTCGLDNISNCVNNLPLHGHYHLLKAKLIQKEVNSNQIIIKAITSFSQLFNQNLKLERTYIFNYLESKFYISDRLINCDSVTSPYCLLYHFNFGYPFLDENINIKFDSDNIISKDDYSKQFINEYDKFKKPKDECLEQVLYCMNNLGNAYIINTKQNLKIHLKYDYNILPILAIWKSYKSYDYALGIEPTTTKMGDQFKYNYLKPNENVLINFELSIDEIK